MLILLMLESKTLFRGVAQLAEHWSPKPGAAGSIPVSPAIYKSRPRNTWLFLCLYLEGCQLLTDEVICENNL